MAPKQIAPPKPRAGQQRHRPVHRTRLDGLGSPAPSSIRGQSPTLVRLSVTPPPSHPSGRPQRDCTNPTCPQPDVSLQDDGSYVCNTCGCVVDQDSGLVAEQTFSDLPGGRTALQGTQVGEGQTHAKSYAPGLGTGPAGREATANREKTERWARTVMNSYNNLLGVEETEVMAGMQIFKLAWAHRFVQGRTIESVAVVCLYLACRRRIRQDGGVRRPYYALMLIDFAEKLNIDVFALGKMYLDLVRKLYLDKTHNDGRLDKDVTANLLAMGPEILIDKFVKELDFAPHSDKVRNDAIRIVSRMKRDWMSTGRRPAGVCGAAIILAARMNNFRRTTREVILTAKVTEITINKRLEEFKDLPSSNLSINEFRDEKVLDAIQPSNPPAYERAINPPQKRKRGRPGTKLKSKVATEVEDNETSNAEKDQSGDANKGQRPAKRVRIDADGYKIPELPKPRQNPIDPNLTVEVTGDDLEQTQDPDNGYSAPVTRKQGRPLGSKNWRAPPPSLAETAIEEELEHDVLETLRDNPELDPSNQTHNPGQSQTISFSQRQGGSSRDADSSNAIVSGQAASKGGPAGPAVNTDIGNTGTVSLSPTIDPTEFDDDQEVSVCLLSEAEQRVKETVWTSENADWLRQDHAKRIKRELKEAEMREKGVDPSKQNQKKGQRTKKDGSKRAGRLGDVSYLQESESKQGATGKEGDEATTADVETAAQELERTAADSVRKMMQTRGVYSRRVNYDVLESLYAFEGSESRSRSRSASTDQAQLAREGSLGASSVASSILILDANHGNRGGRGSARKRNRTSFAAGRREAKERERHEQETQSVTNVSVRSTPESSSASLSPEGDAEGSLVPPFETRAGGHAPARSTAHLPTPDPTQASSAITHTTARRPLRKGDAGVEKVIEPVRTSDINEVSNTSALNDEEDNETDDLESDGDEDGEEDDVDIEAAFDGRYPQESIGQEELVEDE